MASDFVKWAADKIYESIKTEDRERTFLKDLRDHSESVTATITEDIQPLSILYVMGRNEVVGLETDCGDPHCFATCAKYIVGYMRDEMLEEKLAQIP